MITKKTAQILILGFFTLLTADVVDIFLGPGTVLNSLLRIVALVGVWGILRYSREVKD